MGFSSYADVAAALKAESDNWGGPPGNPTPAGWDAAHANANAAREWWANYQASQNSGGGGGGGSAPAPPPPKPAPILPNFQSMNYSDRVVKTAPLDTIVFDNSTVGVDSLAQLLYEDISSVELANISRHDLIDGIDVIYSPIKNLSSIRRQFNPNNMVVSNAPDYFSQFAIDIFTKGIHAPYFNGDGDLVIEIDSISDGEEIQVQILSDGTISTIEET